MKKSILNIGKILNKAEQKQIEGGGRFCLAECSWEFYVGQLCLDESCQLGQCNSQGNCVIGG